MSAVAGGVDGNFVLKEKKFFGCYQLFYGFD